MSGPCPLLPPIADIESPDRMSAKCQNRKWAVVFYDLIGRRRMTLESEVSSAFAVLRLTAYSVKD